MPTVVLSPIGGAGEQFFDNSGNVLSGGLIYTYAAGTTTPLATYTSITGVTTHSNPIVLNSAGRVSTGEVWLVYGSSYKFVLKTSTGTTIATYDNITGTTGGLNVTESVTTLAALTGMSDGERVLVKNWGFYRYDLTSVVTGNDALVVEPDTSIGRWILEVDGDVQRSVYSVTTFGAVGDGVTNDRAAIQAALDAAKAAGGGIVFMPKGVYLINTALTMASALGVQVVGVSGGAGASSGTVIKVGANNTHAFTITGGKGLSFRDLFVTRDSSFTGTGDAFNCSAQTSDCRWHDVTVSNMDVAFYTDFSWQNTFYGCRTAGCKKGAYITVAGGSSNDTKFIGCDFFTGSTYGVHINANTVYLINCDFETNSANAATLDVYGQFGDDCIIQGCTSMYRGIETNMKRTRIIGNQLGKATGVTQTGIYAKTQQDAIIEGNTISGATGNGIVVRFGARAVVVGNMVKNSSAEGINLVDMTDCIVTGNICHDDQGTKTQTFGIRTQGTSDNNIITSNDVRNNLTGGLSIVGSSNIVSNNLPAYTGSIVWNPGNLVDGAGETSSGITVTGASLGDFVLFSAPYDLQGITATGYVSASNTVTIRLQNETGGAIDLASGTWKVVVLKS